jgi:hypothetical protein
MYPCIHFVISANSVISHPHPTYVEVDFASIDSIHGAVEKQIVPDDGEASKREQQHGMQEVRRQKKGW